MEEGHEEFRTSRVSEEFLWSYHTVLRGVVEVPHCVSCWLEAGAPIDEVVPHAITVAAFAGIGFLREVFPESAGVIGCEGVAGGKTEGGGGGVACGWGVAVRP